MPEELSKRYEPATIEQRLYEFWEKGEFFTPLLDPERPKFSIVIPPPNITGRLHIGHALVNTLQDIIVRWKRMSGFNTLWLPGTDHAGIATQMIVDRELAKEGVSRFDLGREKFVERVWEWKESYGHQIIDQLKRLGASADWTRLRFTLDEGLARAVRTAFVKLHDDGLIYRGIAMVNWCPHCRTAISDVEVEYEERVSKLYYIDYPVADSARVLTIATTRPETMLGDTALAVHPDDERYKDVIGREAILPIANRRIPIVADPIFVDREFGTGVVKVTPAHDKNDYEAGKRNDLPQLQVIDEGGRMTEAAGVFAGLDRFEARTKVVAMLRDSGALHDVKDYNHSIGIHGKCETVIEPMISRQWFVKIEPLARPAIDAVRDGTIRILPQSWEATYFNWMENIHDWTISRQLWWGHRIPAFYCANGHVTVATDAPAACPQCGSTEVTQETDVLDTWFSSGLWPFSTMGWPDDTQDLHIFYPTDVLITGFDILFFWVARMIMFGLRFTGKAPFSQVFLNGLVRDEFGQKMSKTKGNVIDPIDVIDEFGADAVRFTLAIFASGRDIPLARSRMQGYAAFANKIWNASRFAMMHIDTTLGSVKAIDRDSMKSIERWILSRLNETTRTVNRALSDYRFDEASNAIYQFFWHEFCDWYIEMVKPVLLGRHGSEADQQRAKRVLLEVLDRSLRLLHPFMPFITEEIWQKLGGVEPSIMVAPYPVVEETLEDAEAERMVRAVQAMITSVRNARAERGFTSKDRFKLYVRGDGRDAAFFDDYAYLLIDLARLTEVIVNAEPPAGAHHDVVEGFDIAIEFPEKVVTKEQQDRTERELEKSRKELESLDAKLLNEQFVRNAPPAIVQGAQARQAELRARIEKLMRNQ
ncbi:MAG TPA: valine--tRNA ligase [Thermoanaerobaculia bacterium]|jgi:valyl-tRNA synthetase|nr:valine--tRNA ligase [Thermoanaerobaculia bacterium]